MKNLRVFTAFSGYDSQCVALDRLSKEHHGFAYELVGWSEIDKNAIKAHDALFPQYAGRNYGDISKIDWSLVPDFDLFTYSSPCQDFSNAGKQKGGGKGTGTRSSLLWECERAIYAKRPQYLLFENVAAVVSSKFIRLFHEWQLTLERMGYTNFSAILNAKDYGVPQNRERIFMVSILDEGASYEFPAPFPLGIRLINVLEENVPECYYLSKERVESILASTQREKKRGNSFAFSLADLDGVSKTTSTKPGERKCDNFIGEPIVLGWSRDATGGGISRYQVQIANCVTAAKRDNTQNYVVEPIIVAMRGREPSILTPKRTEYGKSVRKQYERGEIMEKRKNIQRLEPRTDGPCNTLTSVQKDNLLLVPINTDKDGCSRTITAKYADMNIDSAISKPGTGYGYVRTAVMHNFRIRKLTERECFRLMDLPDDYIDKIKAAVVCRTHQYKLAGNSIVVACLYHIFRKLYVDTQRTNLTLF